MKKLLVLAAVLAMAGFALPSVFAGVGDKTVCECSDNCNCGSDCTCTADSQCSDGCGCDMTCSCSENCDCGTDCACTADNPCTDDCGCGNAQPATGCSAASGGGCGCM